MFQNILNHNSHCLRIPQLNGLYPTHALSPFALDHKDSTNGVDPEEQRKLSNLGETIDDIRNFVPSMLQKLIPKDKLLPNIMLRICPSHLERVESYLPNIKGHVSYYATCKALQLFLTSFVLNPLVKLHVESIRTSKFPEPNCLYAHTTKVYVRWTTCPEGCMHLVGDNSTAQAKLGSHLWLGIDPEKVVKEHKSWTTLVADLTKAITGKKDGLRFERMILGIFIFELSEDNSQILVHTIEDMNIVERKEEVSKLRVC